MNIGDIKFPGYISTSHSTTTVKGLIKGANPEDYVDSKGYVDPEDGMVWIYCRVKPLSSYVNAYPYFWIEEVDNERKIVKSKPSELIKNAYKIENIMDSSVTTIINTTQENEELYDEAEILDINASVSFYVPIIYDDDDFLKKIVKMIIIEKGIDINRLKSKTDLPYMLPNMKTALQNKTKMSVNYFMAWMELLGCTIDVGIKDNGVDKTNPLKYDHLYDTDTDKMSVVIDGKEKPIDMSKYYRRVSSDAEKQEAEEAEKLLNNK